MKQTATPNLLRCVCMLVCMTGLDARAEESPDVQAARMEEFRDVPFSAIKEDPEIRRLWWDRIWQVWDGGPELYLPDFDDMDRSRYFSAPPEPRMHPRVYLRAEQLPELRQRLKTSKAGRIFWARYQAECARLHAADTPVGSLYRGLVVNRRDAEFDALFASHAYEMAQLMMWESLRILVDDDREAGQQMAAAATHYAQRLQALYDEKQIGENFYFHPHLRALPDYLKEKTLGDKQYQEITAMFQEYSIVPVYDHIYPFMNDAQRATVRKLVANLTENLWIHGMGAPNTGGNWGPHHWKGGEAAIAIEGEEGYDPDTVAGLRQVMTSFYGNDFTRAGGMWEGLGKGTFGSYGLLVAAQRGWDIAATQPVRRTVSRTMLHSMLPGFRHMIGLGGLGSSSLAIDSKTAEVLILKYFYPDDPVINYLYRLCVGEEYEWLSNFEFNTHYAGIRNPLFILLCVTDFAPEQTLDEARAAAVADEGLTLFCPEFSSLSTREHWGDEAAWLHYFARSYNYAHTRNDRGHFTFAGLGRTWSTYNFGRGLAPFSSSYDAHNCSVMTVDGIGTLGIPVKTIAMADTPDATFVASDLKHAWDWRLQTHKNPSQRISPLNKASLQPLMKDPSPSHHVPYSLYPHWRNPGEASGPDLRVPHAPVRHAYRTAGLVRGAHAYAVILDDMERDGQPHLFAWNMALPEDVELESVEGNRILLRETGVTNGVVRKCLVEVLQSDAAGRGLPADARVRVERVDGGISWSDGIRRLSIAVMAPAVRFKVLLYPFREGDALPAVTWEGDEATVAWPDQTDRFAFRIDSHDMTIPSLHRGDTSVMTLEPVHIPLPGAPPGPGFARGYAEKDEVSHE